MGRQASLIEAMLEGHVDAQRPASDALEGVQAVDAVHGRRGDQLAGILPDEALDAGHGRHVAAGQERVGRRSDEQDPVVVEEVDGGLRLGVEAAEDLREVGDLDGSDDDAGERPVRVADAAAQREHEPAAHAGPHRPPEMQPEIRTVPVDPEVAGGPTRSGGRGTTEMGIDVGLSVLVQDEDGAETRCRGGPVEEREPPDLRGDALQLGRLQALDDGLEREIVELDIAVEGALGTAERVSDVRVAWLQACSRMFRTTPPVMAQRTTDDRHAETRDHAREVSRALHVQRVRA